VQAVVIAGGGDRAEQRSLAHSDARAHRDRGQRHVGHPPSAARQRHDPRARPDRARERHHARARRPHGLARRGREIDPSVAAGLEPAWVEPPRHRPRNRRPPRSGGELRERGEHDRPGKAEHDGNPEAADGDPADGNLEAAGGDPADGNLEAADGDLADGNLEAADGGPTDGDVEPADSHVVGP
jgi:hypothetical protein